MMSFTMNKPLLMIPGPTDPPDEVLRRCGAPVFPHYEGDFPGFYDQLVIEPFITKPIQTEKKPDSRNGTSGIFFFTAVNQELVPAFAVR